MTVATISPIAALAAGLAILSLSISSRAEPFEQLWPDSYGGGDEAPGLTGAERDLLAEVRRAMEARGARPCRATARLTAAARQHARSLLTVAVGRRIEPGTVRQALLGRGAFDPVVVPWAVADRPPFDASAWSDRLARRFGDRPPTHCGVAVVESTRRVVAVVLGVRRHLTLQPFPSRWARGDRGRLQGRLVGQYRAPTVMVTTPQGSVLRRATITRGRDFSAWIDFPMPGRYTVEVMATGPQGPEVVALFPVFVDAVPWLATMGDGDGSQQTASPVEGQSLGPAAALLRRLNIERRRAGLPPLLADPQLAFVAEAHSRDMVERHYFGHVSPSGVDLVGRLERAGLEPRLAEENLVRAGSVERAHRRLMESPAHRANILDPEVSDVGVGVIEENGEFVVTEIFVAW